MAPDDRCHLAKWNSEVMKLKRNSKSPLSIFRISPARSIWKETCRVLLADGPGRLRRFRTLPPKDIPQDNRFVCVRDLAAPGNLFGSGVFIFPFLTPVWPTNHSRVAHLLLENQPADLSNWLSIHRSGLSGTSGCSSRFPCCTVHTVLCVNIF
jgi:hypothetical protein